MSLNEKAIQLNQKIIKKLDFKKFSFCLILFCLSKKEPKNTDIGALPQFTF